MSTKRSSLDDGKNNSRAPETSDNDVSGRSQSCTTEGSTQSTLSEHVDLSADTDETGEGHRYDCRDTHWNIEYESEGGQTAPYRCGSWDCYCCAHRMRMNLIEELDRLVEERPEMRRLLTLTVDSDQGPDETGEQHRHLTDRFNALRTELNDRYPGLSYVWIRHEGDERGRPHLHLLVDRYLPQRELSKLTSRIGLGRVVDIRRVNARNAAKYLTSYLGKGTLANLLKGLRRYGSSSDISLDVRGSGGSDDSDWSLMMDDYELTPISSEGPLRRPVTGSDIYLQKVHGGPLGRPPPD